MTEEKEELLRKYYQLTEEMYEALIHDKDEEFFQLLEKREERISSMNQLDAAAGTCLKNDRMEHLFQKLAKLEQAIQKELQKTLGKLSQQVRFVKNEKFLSTQYEENIPVSKGVFYDEKK